MIDLSGVKNVDLECLELTDHSQCALVGAIPLQEACIPNRSDPVLTDFASSAIATNSGTANVTLKDLDIHGLTSRGIIGAIGGDITVERVRIAFNGLAGWDFDDGKGTGSAAGATRARFVSDGGMEWVQ